MISVRFTAVVTQGHDDPTKPVRYISIESCSACRVFCAINSSPSRSNSKVGVEWQTWQRSQFVSQASRRALTAPHATSWKQKAIVATIDGAPSSSLGKTVTGTLNSCLFPSVRNDFRGMCGMHETGNNGFLLQYSSSAGSTVTWLKVITSFGAAGLTTSEEALFSMFL